MAPSVSKVEVDWLNRTVELQDKDGGVVGELYHEPADGHTISVVELSPTKKREATLAEKRAADALAEKEKRDEKAADDAERRDSLLAERKAEERKRNLDAEKARNADEPSPDEKDADRKKAAADEKKE